jgi:hypothetical protein
MSNTLCLCRNMTVVAVSRNCSCMMAYQLLVKICALVINGALSKTVIDGES